MFGWLQLDSGANELGAWIINRCLIYERTSFSCLITCNNEYQSFYEIVQPITYVCFIRLSFSQNAIWVREVVFRHIPKQSDSRWNNTRSFSSRRILCGDFYRHLKKICASWSINGAVPWAESSIAKILFGKKYKVQTRLFRKRRKFPPRRVFIEFLQTYSILVIFEKTFHFVRVVRESKHILLSIYLNYIRPVSSGCFHYL